MWVPTSAAAALLFAQAMSASAPSPAPGAIASAAPKSATPAAASPVVCKSVGDTGSHFVHRICHTPAEWGQIAADARASTDTYQQGSSLGAPK